MEFNSILWLKESQKSPLSREVIHHLNLDKVYEKLLAYDESFLYLCQDKETLQYRQDIFDDLFQRPGFIKDLTNCLEAFVDLKPLYHQSQYNISSLYRIIDLVIIMDKSIAALEAIRQTLYDYKPNSQGLKRLQQDVEDVIRSEAYKKMKADLREIKYAFQSVRSAILSVSMSGSLRPIYAQVTDVLEYPFRFPKAFRRVSDVLSQDPLFLGKRLTSYVPVFKVGKINYDLLEEVEFALKKYKPLLSNFINNYDRLNIQPYLQLYHELNFYSASYALLTQIRSAGLPLSKPHILTTDIYEAKISDGYNIHLALELLQTEGANISMVYNTIQFNENHRYFLLSGANRGGKTTFTQSIGQIQLMAQLGLYVPAASASVSLCDHILTHFPVAEKDTVDVGRFGKECQMFVQSFKDGTSKSLYLLNEPFAGTSHLESLNVAAQGICAMMDAHIPFVMNTHMHELYDEIKEIRGEQGTKHLTNLITQMSGSKSAFKLIPGESLGKSFAREIAKKYGVTYEQLMEKRDEGSKI